MKDIIIRNGTIIDGTKRAAFTGDIQIAGDTIVKIAEHIEAAAEVEIDAQGKIVCPGFIDPHSHADMDLLFAPENKANIMQGVTTFVGGNCGDSPVPVSRENWDMATQHFGKLKSIRPLYYDQTPPSMDRETAIREYREAYGVDVSFETFPEYFQEIRKSGISCNYYPLVGHNNLRKMVMGKDCNRQATPEEVEQMKGLLREILASGIGGMSTGLDYLPGTFAFKEEVRELAEQLKDFDGIYASHVRSRTMFVDGKPGFHQERGIAEALDIGRQGVRVNVSHVLHEEHPRKIQELFDQALAEGVDVSYDVIANVTGGGAIFSHLMYLLRPWYLAAGSPEQLVRNLEDPDYVKMMKREMTDSRWYFTNEKALPGVEEAILITQHQDSRYVGKNFQQIMKETGMSYQDTFIAVIRADPMTKIKYGRPPQEDAKLAVRELFDHDHAIPCSDSFAANEDSELGFAPPLGMTAHNNAYTYAVRYLKDYRRSSLEDSIYAMTGLPAQRFRISRRGVLQEGNFADIVILDLGKLDPNEDVSEPRRFPKGIDYVLVNGAVTAEKGQFTGARSGRVLLRDREI